MGMFDGCTSLTTAPDLPSTVLMGNCYCGMFNNCTNLTATPSLPATVLPMRCYYYMFYGCSSLTEPADMSHVTQVSAASCYYMYNGCTNISISEASTELTIKEWVATSADPETAPKDWGTDMFANTGGTFKGTPVVGTKYYINELDTIEYTCDDVMVIGDGKTTYEIRATITVPKYAKVLYSDDGGSKWSGMYSFGPKETPLKTVKIKIFATGYKTVEIERKVEIAPAIKDTSTPTFTGITGTLTYNKGKLKEDCVIYIDKDYVEKGGTTVLIYKDGSTTPIETSNYEVGSGSTKITIYDDYLNDLDAGTHNFKLDVTYASEGTYSYNLVITVKSNPTPTPPYVPVDTGCK